VQRLQDLGWIDRRNLTIDYRWAGGNADDIRAAAAELAGKKLDVVLAFNPPAAIALKQQTRSTPVVFVNVADALGSGIVESLSRPGGNLTGFTNFEPSIASKWLELLKHIAPLTNQVAVIENPANPAMAGYLRVLNAAASSFAVQLTTAPVSELEHRIKDIAPGTGVGLIVLPDPGTIAHSDLVIRLADRYRLPTIYFNPDFVRSGGLLSYGPEAVEPFRQAAAYVDRILKGEKPGDLPVQGATKFELAINLRTAKVLGLDIPGTLLTAADDVIE
jgi:putative ABC transport system substrate-binding protein